MPMRRNPIRKWRDTLPSKRATARVGAFAPAAFSRCFTLVHLSEAASYLLSEYRSIQVFRTREPKASNSLNPRFNRRNSLKVLARELSDLAAF